MVNITRCLDGHAVQFSRQTNQPFVGLSENLKKKKMVQHKTNCHSSRERISLLREKFPNRPVSCEEINLTYLYLATWHRVIFSYGDTLSHEFTRTKSETCQSWDWNKNVDVSSTNLMGQCVTGWWSILCNECSSVGLIGGGGVIWPILFLR